MDDKIVYNTIIEELEKCNCKEDFENLIEGNDFLRENRKYFEWLLESNRNDLLNLYGNKLDIIIKIYNSDELKIESDREKFKRDFFTIINKYKCKDIFTKNIEGLCKIIANKDIENKLFVDLIEAIIIGNRRESDKDYYEMVDVDRSKINELEEKIKSEDFIKKEVIKIVGENNIGIYLNTIGRIFKDYADILARYKLPIIMGISNMGKDNDYINNSLFYRIFLYLCGFEDSYKALKKQFDLAIVSIMNDLGKSNKVLADSNKELQKEIERSNKELQKEIEKKKSQKEIIEEVEEVYKQNLDMYKDRWKGFLNINNILLGLSIVGSLLTFTDKFRELIGIKDTLEFNSVKDVIIIIMLKIPFLIIGLIAYGNIQRNRFFKEEYQYKNTVMKIFNQFREDSDDEVRDKSKLIMLEMFKENPNDKLIKKDKDITEKIIKVIENTVKTALQKEKNSNK